MFSPRFAALVALLSFGLACAACADRPKAADKLPSSIHALTVKDIDGKTVKLSSFKGKVLLVVNTASKCGLTPQYEGLQTLYRTYKDRGLVVLGFPSNDFGGQEPGTTEEIKTFCEERFKVTFPMFDKVHARGKDTSTLYRVLTEASAKPLQGEIKWNFTKFLIGRDGKTLARFEPRTTPEEKTVIAAIEQALGPAK